MALTPDHEQRIRDLSLPPREMAKPPESKSNQRPLGALPTFELPEHTLQVIAALSLPPRPMNDNETAAE